MPLKTNRLGAFLAAALAAGAASSAVAADGFLAPGAGESVAPGSIVDVRWASLCGGAERGVDEAELVLSLDGGETFPIRVTPDLKPCATHVLWKVPALPAAHARLALRAGSDERDATETIEIVSRDFRILPDPDGRVAELKRRAAEWFVPSEPGVSSAEDLLETRLSGSGNAVRATAARFDLALTTTFSGAMRPSRGINEDAPARREAAVSFVLSSARPAGAPTPLRL